MACKYKINGVWYSEEEVKSIFEQSEKKSKEYYALVDKLESATPEEKQDIEAKIAELDKEFLVESKEELPPTVISETIENTPSEIYSKLGDKTRSNNVIIKSVFQNNGIEYAKSINGVFSLRVNNSDKHFGNPFSPVDTEIAKGLIPAKNTRDAVEKYIDWVLTSSEDRAKWIRDILKSGVLKNKPVVYYKELGEPSHATALDYLINEYNWQREEVIPETTEKVPTESLEVKPEVKEIFESNPELQSIGTVEQYSKYIDSIFPESKVKEVVYHGSMSKDIEYFDKSKLLSGEGANAFGQGFYFTKAKNTARFYSDSLYANMYNPSKMDEGDALAYKSMTNEEREEIFTGKTYPVLINAKKPISWEESSNEKRGELKNGEYKENDSIIHESKGFTKIHGDKEELEGLLFELSNNELAIEEGNLGDPEYILSPEVKKELIIRNETIKLKLKSFNEFIHGETHFIVPDPEQIHILGSKLDSQGFKDFVGKNDNIETIVEGELPEETIPFIVKVDQFLYTLNPNTGEVIHNAKVGDKVLTNDTQINKVYAAYAKELSLPIKTFNNQEYVKVFDRIINTNNSNQVTQKEIVELFTERASTEDAVNNVEATYTFEYNNKKIKTEFQLSEDQEKALKELIDFTKSQESMIVLQGAAGTGKTAIIGYLQKYMGSDFLYTAPTHAATVELAAATLRSGNKILPSTVASSLAVDSQTGKWKLSKKAAGKIRFGNTIIVDEVSMLSAKDYIKLKDLASSGYKIIFLGDKKQIPEVTSNGDAKSISSAFTSNKAINLDTIHRTSNSTIKSILQKVRDSKVFQLFKPQENTDNVQFLDSDLEFRNKLAEFVTKDPQNTDYIAYTNKAVSDMNTAIREGIFKRTGPVQVGDIVMGYLGYSSKQIEKGDLANSVSYEVTNVKKEGSTYILELKSDRLDKLRAAGVKGIKEISKTVYVPLSNKESLYNDMDSSDYLDNNIMLSFNFKDLFSTLQQAKANPKKWGDYYGVQVRVADVLAKMDLGADYIYNPENDSMEAYSKSNPSDAHKGLFKKYGSDMSNFIVEKGIDFGHAITIHKAQGRTTKNVFFDANTITKHDVRILENGEQISTERQSLGYVGLSRASENLFVNTGWIDFKEINTPEEYNRSFENTTPKQLPTLKLPRSERDVVKPSQVLMPWKFKAKMSKYIKNGKLDMSKIDPKILTGFGMRIPNQGPNSQVAFEIVGFFPKEAVDQIIASKDLVTQMGHDFDFDTMYTYLYDSVEIDGVLTPITKELIDRVLPDYNISRKQLNELIYPIKEELKEYSDILDTLNEVYIENAYSANTTDLIQKARAEKLEKELKGKLKEAKSNFSHSIKNLKELLLLKQLVDAGDTAALKNELVDTHIAVHNNPSSEVQKQIKRPIGSWILADYAKKMDKVSSERKDRELQRIKAINEEIIKENATSKNKKPLVKLPVDISPMSDLSQTTKFVSGTAGKAGVGVYSLYNTFLSVMAQKEDTNPDEQIIYKTRASQGKKGLKDWYINIGGTRSNGRLCSPYTISGKTLKTEVAEGFQSVSVDNANDVVMDKINLNKHTFKFTVGAISLGFKDEIPRMMTQPIIFDYVAAIQNGTKVGSVARDVEKKALKEVEAKYKAILGRPITEENGDYSNKVYLQSLGDSLTVEKLDEMIALEGNSVDFALLQLSTLTIFKELENVGASIQGIMGNANTDSAMLSKNLIETSAKQSLLESNLQKSTITNIDKVLGYFKGYSGDMNNLIPTTINGAATKYGLVFTNKLWNSIIPYNDPAIKKFFTATEQAFGITATSVGQLGRHRETMWSNLKSFLFTNPNLLNIEGDVVAEKNRLFIDIVADGNKAANESLSTYVSKLKQTVTKYSFLNVLESYDSKDSSKPSYLYTTDAALESADINLLYASFLDLFLNDKPLPDWNGKPYSTRRLAEDLAVGALLMGGVVNAKNYIRLIPPAYMYNIQGKNDSENYIDKLSNYVRTPNFGFLFDRVDMNAVVEQIVQNNPDLLPKKSINDFTYKEGYYVLINAVTENEITGELNAIEDLKKKNTLTGDPYYSIITKENITRIFVRVNSSMYKELVNKNMKNFRNYNYTQVGTTSPQSHIQLVDNSPKLEITPNKNIEETRDLGLKDGGKEVVDFALNMISTTSKSTYYRKLADLMKDMTKDKKIVVKTGRITNNKGEVVKGNYESSNGTTTISINTDSNSYPMGMNELDLEESLLHELSHSISIDSYKRGKALMEQGKAGVAITTIIVSLDNLFADYQNKVKELKVKGLAKNIPNNSTKDIFEFMAELFANQDLQKLIDTMEYSKHRTLLQRFTELLEKLITALGFNLDTTTALALADIIELASMPEVNVADTDGNTIPDGSASRAFEKYFPTITEVINKYGIFKDGIRASYTNRIDADAKVNTINSEQGVYKASVYTQSNGTFAVNLVRDSRMDNVDYAYEQLTQEGRNKLNNDIC